MEDEIDLRKYIDVLLRHWKLIVGIALIAVFVAGLVSFLLPSTYEAKATVAIARTKPEVVLGPMYWTYIDKNGNNLPSGIYLIRLLAGNLMKTRKILLIR